METVEIDAEWVETFKTISKEEINSPTRINRYDIPYERIGCDADEFEKIITSNMETVAVDDQWIETFKTISIEEINSPTKINKYEIPTNFDCEEFQKMMTEKCEKISEQRKIRMKRMKPLFASQPRLQMTLQKKNDGTPLSLSTFNTPGSIKKTPGILAPTPAKNKVNINPETSIDGAQTPAEQKQLKQQSSLNLGALPAPKNHYQIVIPDNEITDETADNQDDDIIEDQADIDARK
ncbi:hypothetical protein HCN44_000265 [Aphidius gifuensis]|uniref:Pre-mRNA splicing factor component Cdc5p/Cef1 C-terminal domain-containing protein n=1 Tax=Aphidius gifuensis TaxID=684658 RepID=A0A834XRL0_APHGI|nr:hypothetical protein HCN44_000265 [Aphidius gifuensis]